MDAKQKTDIIILSLQRLDAENLNRLIEAATKLKLSREEASNDGKGNFTSTETL